MENILQDLKKLKPFRWAGLPIIMIWVSAIMNHLLYSGYRYNFEKPFHFMFILTTVLLVMGSICLATYLGYCENKRDSKGG